MASYQQRLAKQIEQYKPSAFQNNYRSLGLGGKQQQSGLQKIGDVRKNVLQTGADAQRESYRQVRGQLAEQGQQQARGIANFDEDISMARQYANEDVQKYKEQVNRQRMLFAQELERRKEQMKQQLEGIVSDEQLETEMSGYNNLIQGLTYSVIAADEAGLFSGSGDVGAPATGQGLSGGPQLYSDSLSGTRSGPYLGDSLQMGSLQASQRATGGALPSSQDLVALRQGLAQKEAAFQAQAFNEYQRFNQPFAVTPQTLNILGPQVLEPINNLLRSGPMFPQPTMY